MDKKEIRAYIKNKKAFLTEKEIRELSDIIKGKLETEFAYSNCSHLFCYVSFNQEVLTTNIIIEAMAKSKKIAVPKIVKNEMKFFYIESLEDLQPGTLGILEPVSGEEAIPSNNNTNLILVPGLAFDKNKNRIGYGKGYYDQFFEKYSKVPMTKIALAYDFQVLEQIPHETFDIKVDKVLTNIEIVK
jgi:5-formyltetrahydrofolate cyclo-ligase